MKKQEKWNRYFQNSTDENRNLVAEEYTDYVRYIAQKIIPKFPRSVQIEELISYGWVGLLDAIEKYDPDRETKFTSYAYTRIWGEMMSGLRRNDRATRRQREKQKEYKKSVQALWARLGRKPTDLEIAKHLDRSLVELSEMREDMQIPDICSIEANKDNGDRPFTEIHEDESAEDPVQEVQSEDFVRETISHLEEREREIFYKSAIKNRTYRDIGRDYGVSESRICQVVNECKSQLQEEL